MWCCLRLDPFSHFDRTLVCVGRMGTHTSTACTALSTASHGKNCCLVQICTCSIKSISIIKHGFHRLSKCNILIAYKQDICSALIVFIQVQFNILHYDIFCL